MVAMYESNGCCGMRLVLKDVLSKQFYRGEGVWTSELNEAFDFQYYAGKPDYADQLDNVGVELVIDAEYRKGATQCCVGSLS
jgi:hypothetical protein